MIARNLTSRKHAQAVTRLKMHYGAFDAPYAALPFGILLEGVDGKETLLEIGDV